jgi:hypothetical protein
MQNSTRAGFKALQAVSTFATQVWRKSPDYLDQIATFIKNWPEFESSGRDDKGGVWAKSAEAELVMFPFVPEYAPESGSTASVAVNSPGPSTSGPTLMGQRATARKRSAAPTGSTETYTLHGPPKSKKAYLINALHSSDRGANIGLLERYLKGHGYDPHVVQPTLEQLEKLADAGIVYIMSHAMDVKREGAGLHIMTDEYVGALDDEGLDRWANILMTRPQNEVGLFFDGNDKNNYIAISPDFIKNHWSGLFAENGLFWLDGCEGDELRFQQIVFDAAKARFLMCWQGGANVPACKAAVAYFFDRALGVNEIEKKDPPNRPFDYQSIYHVMIDHVPSLVVADFTDPLTGKHTAGRLEFLATWTPVLDFSSGILLPSIYWFSVSEDDKELVLKGLFGVEGTGAKISIAGTPLTIKSWLETEVHCELPSASGKVLVELDGRQSNPRWLTEWSGDFTYSDLQTWKEPRPAAGQIGLTVSFHLHFRGDILQTRAKPELTPSHWKGGPIMGRDGHCAAQGSLTKKVRNPRGGFAEVKGSVSPKNETLSMADIDAHFALSRDRDKAFIEFILLGAAAVVTWADGSRPQMYGLGLPNFQDGQSWVTTPGGATANYLEYAVGMGKLPKRRYNVSKVLDRTPHEFEFTSSEISILGLPEKNVAV